MKSEDNQVGNFCPLIKKDCIEHSCKFYTKLQGKHPQDGSIINHWDCAITWLPIMLAENTQKTNELGAAMESFRNEMGKGQTAFNNILANASEKIRHLHRG